jgi:hypothetical protein
MRKIFPFFFWEKKKIFHEEFGRMKGRGRECLGKEAMSVGFGGCVGGFAGILKPLFKISRITR